MAEFELIEKFFKNNGGRSDVALGIGDDCAIVEVPQKHQLAVTTDTLVSGVHFPSDTSPFDIGYKSLAVNLSDLSAMGATPAWVTLALTMPEANENWLKEFCRGFFELAKRFGVELIGGDLTRGPLSITVQAQGFLPEGKALKRSGAKVGDLIFVTNTLGDAGLALQKFDKRIEDRLNRPEPRVSVGEKLLGVATAAIDISDGLAADLGHILKNSNVGATVIVDHLPLSAMLKESVSADEAISLALNSGDDYELCFTASPENEKLVAQISHDTNVLINCIGKITSQKSLALQFENGKIYDGKITGYQHF
jgi:thiamine-monophosphate kinase